MILDFMPAAAPIIPGLAYAASRSAAFALVAPEPSRALEREGSCFALLIGVSARTSLDGRPAHAQDPRVFGDRARLVRGASLRDHHHARLVGGALVPLR